MKTNILHKKFLLVAGFCLLAVFAVLSQKAYAITPTVSASLTGSGDNVLLNVTGDPNSNVILNYLNNSSAVQMSALGVTNSSGSFSVTVSTAAYGIHPNSLFSVTINSQQSVASVWPYATSTASTASLSLSQTSLSLSSGQSATITAYNNNTSVLYLSSNSNPSVANVSINGNQFTVSANTGGSTTITVCSLANSSNCASVSVTVPTASSQITFNQSSVSIAYGQNLSVSVAGGTGIYSVVSNSNPSVIQATISGSSLNLYANSSSGSANITVCSTNMSSCGVVNVTASGSSNSSILSFSQSNPVITIGQVSPITVSGGTGSYYVSSNSNTGAVQANLVGNTLSLYGNYAGSAILTICSSGSGCGTVSATVVSPGTTPITFSQNNITVSVGQVSNLAISGAGNYYISSNSSSSVASASINGNTLVITANNAGSDSITVCQTGGQCAIAYITVSSSGSSLALNPSNLTLSVGQTSNVVASGIGGYYISGNSNSSVASAAVSGNSITVTALSVGSNNITICQSNSQCAMLYITVGSAASSQASSSSPSSISVSEVISVGKGINLMVSGGSAPYTLSSNPGTIFTSAISNSNVITLIGVSSGISSVNVCSSNGGCATINVVVVNPSAVSTVAATATSYKFNNLLKIGSSGADVTALQQRLTSEGVYSGPITGYYGLLTKQAVEKYQEQHKIANPNITGYGELGPHTRSSLNGN
ncbi:MAG: peptidoglycan-binding protein [Patescibacteria group bacterium]|nr:peptidoglycan-binding protein [Patescibacteria group bacterium]